MICQSHKIGCVWKPGFLKSGHILVASYHIYKIGIIIYWVNTNVCLHVSNHSGEARTSPHQPL